MLIIVSGYFQNTHIAVNALSIWLVPSDNNLFIFFKNYFSFRKCHTSVSFSFLKLVFLLHLSLFVSSVTIYGWESMIPLGFLAATG